MQINFSCFRCTREIKNGQVIYFIRPDYHNYYCKHCIELKIYDGTDRKKVYCAVTPHQQVQESINEIC